MTEEKNDYSKVDFAKEIPFIRKRFPHLQGKELEDAEERFRDWVRLLIDSCYKQDATL